MDLVNIQKKLCEILEPHGFECYPFKIGWYNEMVTTGFHLAFDPDTLAFVVVSTPGMFDQAFKPYVCRQECTGVGDLIDSCVADQFSKIQQEFADLEIECIHDFELHPSRRPKVLVQTAGHVAGAAYYYQRKDVQNDPWPATQKISGVSIHPLYGGWFALRGVIIFKTICVPELEQKAAPDSVPTDELRIELLERFNFHWRDWSFRDIVPTKATYSQEQRDYFLTPPQQRGPLISKIRTEGQIGKGSPGV
jgi:methylmalonic aciduria homocystinuria type C protein